MEWDIESSWCQSVWEGSINHEQGYGSLISMQVIMWGPKVILGHRNWAHGSPDDITSYDVWKFMNLTHQKPLLQYLVYYILLVLSINKLFININTEINTKATFTHMQINNWNKLRQHKGHRYFWTIVPGKIQCGKTVQQIWGFYYYVVFWIQLGCQKWLTLQRFSLAKVPFFGGRYSI